MATQDMVFRHVTSFVLQLVIENVATAQEYNTMSKESLHNLIHSEVNKHSPDPHVLNHNTPIGIVANRLLNKLDTDEVSMEHVQHLFETDPTSCNLIHTLVYDISAGYSHQLNELRTIVPSDVEHAMSHVNSHLKTVQHGHQETISLYPHEYFTWGRLEDPSHVAVLSSFLQKNANVLKSEASSISSIHTYNAIMKRIEPTSSFQDTTISDDIVSAFNIDNDLKDLLTSNVKWINFINYTKTVMSLSHQDASQKHFLTYARSIETWAPIVQDMMNKVASYDDMTDTLVNNLNIMNHMFMMIEGILMYHMETSFKSALVLPTTENKLVINKRVYDATYKDQKAEDVHQNIEAVMYYLTHNFTPVCRIRNEPYWISYKSGLTTHRIDALQDKATAYREHAAHEYLKEQQRREFEEIRKAVSAHVDTWFENFVQTHDIPPGSDQHKAHATHKKLLLDKIKPSNVEATPTSLDTFLMDYFVNVRSNGLLSNLYTTTHAYYKNHVQHAKEDATPSQDPRNTAQVISIVQTFLDFFVPKYTTPLNKAA